MRLITYDRGGARRLGAWAGQQVVDLPAVVGHPAFPTTMESLVARHGGTVLEAARAAMSQPSLVQESRVRGPRILAPIIPISLLEHRWILGPGDRLPWPPDAEEIDYTVEIACILGGGGRDLTPEEAESIVFGYTLMNDWSLRAVTHRGSADRRARPTPTRFATSLGPCVVTADEFDPTRGRLAARVDGELWSEGSLAETTATFGEMIAALSEAQALYPGDVVGSGTFPGGCAHDLGRRLAPGATVELEAEGIGVLRNRVGHPAAGRAA